MQLISIESSRVILLFVAGRADGTPYLPDAAAALVERYRFVERPTKIEELTGERIHFGRGAFSGRQIEAFDIFSDGVIAEGKMPTEVLDEFLNDVIEWMEPTFGFKKIETHDISRTYDSNIIVQTDAKLLACIDAMSDLLKALSSSLHKANGMNHKFQSAGFSLAVDGADIAGLKPSPFRVERRAEIAFSKNLYFSAAPLPTKAHVEVLSRLEKLTR